LKIKIFSVYIFQHEYKI